MNTRTITLFVASNEIIPGAKTLWYVCTEKPHRKVGHRLDAPWIYGGTEDEEAARSYARAVVHSYRDNTRLRYALADEEPA